MYCSNFIRDLIIQTDCLLTFIFCYLNFILIEVLVFFYFTKSDINSDWVICFYMQYHLTLVWLYLLLQGKALFYLVVHISFMLVSRAKKSLRFLSSCEMPCVGWAFVTSLCLLLFVWCWHVNVTCVYSKGHFFDLVFIDLDQNLCHETVLHVQIKQKHFRRKSLFYLVFIQYGQYVT